jgi:hypothetical protein
MKGLTNWVRFWRGEPFPGKVPVRDAPLGEEPFCEELLRLSSRTTPNSNASTSAARIVAPRRPILRKNLPRGDAFSPYIILDRPKILESERWCRLESAYSTGSRRRVF